jgi:hypothetical protein
MSTSHKGATGVPDPRRIDVEAKGGHVEASQSSSSMNSFRNELRSPMAGKGRATYRVNQPCDTRLRRPSELLADRTLDRCRASSSSVRPEHRGVARWGRAIGVAVLSFIFAPGPRRVLSLSGTLRATVGGLVPAQFRTSRTAHRHRSLDDARPRLQGCYEKPRMRQVM